MADGQSLEWIWWRSAARLEEFERGANVDCLFVPEVNEYRGPNLAATHDQRYAIGGGLTVSPFLL